MPRTGTTKDVRRGMWGIPKFELKLRDRFTGMARTRNVSVRDALECLCRRPELLEALFDKWIWEDPTFLEIVRRKKRRRRKSDA